MKKQIQYMSILLAGLLTLSCQGEKKAASLDIGSTDPDGPTVVDEVEGVPSGSPLYFKLGTAWESDTSETFSYSSPCYIDAGSVAGTSKTCTLSVPEAKLFFSSVRFRAGSLNTTQCGILKFQPYYFRRSNDKFYNDWDSTQTAIDCRNNSEAAECYGGVAPLILGDDWPANKLTYFLPAAGNQMDWDVLSSNSVRNLGPDVNWMITNDLANPSVGVNTPPNADPEVAEAISPRERIGSAWTDYRVSCVDIWGEPQYILDLVISDQNTVSTVNGGVVIEDTYPDWY